MSTRRNKQNRIGTEAENIFRDSLPNNERLDITLEEVRAHDYGIDGLLQIFKNEEFTGETPYIQIKGQENLKFTKEGVFIQRMKMEHMELFLEKLTNPAFLIVSDTKNKKCYWLDLQIDPLTTELFLKAKRKKQKTLTLYINPKNSLPETYQDFLAAVSNSKLHIQERNELQYLRQIAKTNFDLALQKLDTYAKNLINIPGFSLTPTKKSSTPMMRITTSSGITSNLYPNKSFKPGDEPEIDIQFQVPEKDKKNIKILGNIQKDPSCLSELNPKYISSLQIKTAHKTLEDYPNLKHNLKPTKIIVNPIKQQRQLFLHNKETKEEIAINVETWVNGEGNIIISTPEHNTQLLNLSGNIEVEARMLTINIRLLVENIQTIKESFRIFQLFNYTSEDNQIELYLNTKGFKILIGTYQPGYKFVSEENLNFYKTLYRLQDSIKEELPFPEKITAEDVENIRILKSMLLDNEPPKSFAFTIVKPKIIPRQGLPLTITLSDANLFGVNVHLKTNSLIKLKGTISEVHKDRNTYKITCNRVVLLKEHEKEKAE
ncbi:DUF4365 domain-containing protein [Patescibacteria group bacterium]|nr:DUF4365 domain-containing protein [Patescibacteria group bacterium]HQA87776.1 DUF4365 domain-containing protein [Candidatus Dojkabacteria bacterium]